MSTNDDGPFMGGKFWGLNYLPENNSSKRSEAIIFNTNDIDRQTWSSKGNRLAFAVSLFHFPKNQLSHEDQNASQIEYKYKNFKYPVLLKLINEKSNNYIIGISCMKSREENVNEFGCRLTGGVGEINKKTETCKNISVIFPY